MNLDLHVLISREKPVSVSVWLKSKDGKEVVCMGILHLQTASFIERCTVVRVLRTFDKIPDALKYSYS